MKVKYFNLWTSNFCIGLLLNHRYVSSAARGLKNSGYTLFRLEQEFIAGTVSVTPELLATSLITGHTLMTEWTAAETLTESKQNQIHRYVSVKQQDLVDNAGIIPSAAISHAVWIIIRPEAELDFTNLIESKNAANLPTPALLSTFFQSETDGQFHLCFKTGTVVESSLQSILSSDWKFKRIPTGYLKAPINGVSYQDLVTPITAAIVSFVAQNKLAFSELEICEEVYQLWPFIAVAMQSDLIRKVRTVLRLMRRRRYVKTRFSEAWLQSLSDGQWLIVIPPNRDLGTFLSRLKRISGELVTLVETKTRQLDIEDDLLAPDHGRIK